jgi:heme a synthase
MRSRQRPALIFRAACFLVGSILFLITLGGQVTTKVAGMAVPDWPGTFGHNMLIYPWSSMTASTMVFLEHSHRLVASGVGLITLAVTIWVWLTQPAGWARRFAMGALVLVILQGILGGQRVIQVSWVLGLLHGCLAQLYLLVAGSLALVLSRFWENPRIGDDHAAVRTRWIWILSGFVFLQTILGAFMRHDGPGFLAVPDFPKVYGEWLPAFWEGATLQKINEYRAIELQWPATTSSLILWQILHRSLGILTAGGIFLCAFLTIRATSTPAWWRHGMVGWSFLALAQIVLGVSVIWTGRLPELATLHVLLGATLILAGWLLGLASWRSTQLISIRSGSRAPMPQSSIMEKV